MPGNNKVIPELLATGEAAERYRLDQDTISRLCREKKILGAFKNENGEWLIPDKSIRDYLSKSKNITIWGRSELKWRWLSSRRWFKILAAIFAVLSVTGVIIGFIVDIQTLLFPTLPTNVRVPETSTSFPPQEDEGAEIPSSSTLIPTSTPDEAIFTALSIHPTGLHGKPCSYGKLHAIVRDMSSNLHLFIISPEDPTIIFEAISTNNGETWSPPDFVSGFDVSGSISGFGCSAAVDVTGTIHLIFNLDFGDAAYTRWSETENWRQAVIRGQGLPDVGTFAADIAVGPDQQVHTIWSSRKIWYTFYDGIGWTGETEVAPGQWHPDIFVDEDGARHVVYNSAGYIPIDSDDPASFEEVYYTYSKDGFHWTEETVVNSKDNIWTGAAAIVVDPTGRRHVTFIRDAELEGDLYYTYSEDGEAWSLPVKLNQHPGVQTGETGKESASMTLDQWGNVYVVWKGLDAEGEYQIYLRQLDIHRNEWSEIIEVARICSAVGCHPSVPYRPAGQPSDMFLLDIVWPSDGEVMHALAVFKLR